MHFMLARGGWFVQFLEADLKTSLPRKFTFQDSAKVIEMSMRRMGIEKEEMCGHGFRAAARTIMDEVLNIRVDYIEHQLAHAVKDANGRAYNRTAHLAERKIMMQQWADYLDNLRLVQPNL